MSCVLSFIQLSTVASLPLIIQGCCAAYSFPRAGMTNVKLSSEGLTVLKDFARVVYRTKAWQDCREAYAKSKGYLCERCLKKGIYSPGVIVHHKIHLNPDNVTDPRIAMSFDNLELLCRFCHAEEHEEEIKEAQAKRPSKRRYTIDEQGRVKCLL